MASKGYVISVATDSRLFEQGVRMGIIKPVEEADDALTDLGKNRGADQLEGDIKAAQKATAGLNREIEETSDSIRAAQRQSRRFGDDTGDSFHKAGKNVEEFKDEARQNFSEVTSSFDGSMDSVLDLAQGTFGGLAGSIAGPLGIVAGLGAAALGGIFTSMVDQADAAGQEAAQRISDMYEDMIESGNDYISQDFVNQSIKETIEDEGKLAAVRDRASEAGVSMQTALRAEAGDRDAINSILAITRERYEGLHEDINEVVSNGGKVSGELAEQAASAYDLNQHFENLAKSQDTASAHADLYRQAISETSKAIEGASNAAGALRGQLDAFHDVNVQVSVDDAVARERLRQLGKAINVDMYVTPRTGRGIN